jgi:hypothetical protein
MPVCVHAGLRGKGKSRERERGGEIDRAGHGQRFRQKEKDVCGGYDVQSPWVNRALACPLSRSCEMHRYCFVIIFFSAMGTALGGGRRRHTGHQLVGTGSTWQYMPGF